MANDLKAWGAVWFRNRTPAMAVSLQIKFIYLLLPCPIFSNFQDKLALVPAIWACTVRALVSCWCYVIFLVHGLSPLWLAVVGSRKAEKQKGEEKENDRGKIWKIITKSLQKTANVEAVIGRSALLLSVKTVSFLQWRFVTAFYLTCELPFPTFVSL